MKTIWTFHQQKKFEYAFNRIISENKYRTRGGSRTAATSKMGLFVIIVNGGKPSTIITKSSILDVAAVLDPLLGTQIPIQNASSFFEYLDTQTWDKRDTYCKQLFFTKLLQEYLYIFVTFKKTLNGTTYKFYDCHK